MWGMGDRGIQGPGGLSGAKNHKKTRRTPPPRGPQSAGGRGTAVGDRPPPRRQWAPPMGPRPPLRYAHAPAPRGKGVPLAPHRTPRAPERVSVAGPADVVCVTGGGGGHRGVRPSSQCPLLRRIPPPGPRRPRQRRQTGILADRVAASATHSAPSPLSPGAARVHVCQWPVCSAAGATKAIPSGKVLMREGGCIRRGGGGSGTPKFVYQKWPNQIFPIVNFVFSHDGHFGLGGGGGLGEGVPPSPPLLGFVYTDMPCSETQRHNGGTASTGRRHGACTDRPVPNPAPCPCGA